VSRAATDTAALSSFGLERDEALELYRRMRLIRRFEETVQLLFQRGEVPGTTHLYTGEEAVATGVSSVLGQEDRIAGTYRGHGHALSVGVDPQALLDEMLGRATGVCKGRAGSMNVIDLSHRLIGCFGIVGGSIAAATGAAIALKRSGGVAVAFFGEGATNQGYFHECLNFAKVLNLPVLYVCENNLYGEFTPMAAVTAGADIPGRARSFGMPSLSVDGNDVWAVEEAAREAVERARSGGGPTLLETRTYRHYGHSKSDPGDYRTDGELEQWMERDPLRLTRERLLAEGIAEERLVAVEAAVEEQMSTAVDEALAAPYPDPAVERASEFR
jgi:acetoin:2,6-dichlorophenolindophenol oxidoreductase subunit alpha